MSPSITEKTKISLPIGVAWSVVFSSIAATVWITTLLLNMQYKLESLYLLNQRDHASIMLRLERVEKHDDYDIDATQFENSIIVYHNFFHPKLNMNDESNLRNLIRTQTKPTVSLQQDAPSSTKSTGKKEE